MTPAEHSSVSRRAQTDPWVERDLDPTASGERLHPEQPDTGLLWVLAGTVEVHREGRSREVRPGTVVSYRVGAPLTWSAGEGSRVRWSGRPVKLDVGEVASWTANLALEIPGDGGATEPRRRGLYATAAIAATWVIALTVAWCYHQAQANRSTAPKPTSTTSSWASSSSSKQKLPQKTLDARSAEAMAAFTEMPMVRRAFLPGKTGQVLQLEVNLPEGGVTSEDAEALEAASRPFFGRWSGLERVNFAFYASAGSRDVIGHAAVLPGEALTFDPVTEAAVRATAPASPASQP